jgi:hypothetical protein
MDATFAILRIILQNNVPRLRLSRVIIGKETEGEIILAGVGIIKAIFCFSFIILSFMKLCIQIQTLSKEVAIIASILAIILEAALTVAQPLIKKGTAQNLEKMIEEKEGF